MSLSQWGASGSDLFLASELILAAATLSKAHEADSLGLRTKAPGRQGPEHVPQKTLVSRRNQLGGDISPVPTGLELGMRFKTTTWFIISETSVLRGAGEAGKWLWSISHSGVRSLIVASWREVGRCLVGGVPLLMPFFLPGCC